jgi:hypothetical protein
MFLYIFEALNNLFNEPPFMFKIIAPLLFVFCTFSIFAQKQNAELAYLETHISVKNGKLYKKSLYKIRIYNRAGEKYTKVRIPYSGIRKIKKIEASIEDWSGKTIKKLKKSNIIDKSAISNISFYEDHFVKEFTLKHNSYPYLLNYSYEVQFDEFLHIANWYPIVDSEIPTKTAKLIIEHPNDYKILKNVQFVENYKSESIENIKKHTWTSSYENVLKEEEYAPSIYTLIPNVLIVPEKFIYGLEGSFVNWKEFGDWECNLSKGLNDLPTKEKAALISKVQNIEDKKEKIKHLFHYLQDKTRYINVSVGIGGMKPYPASYVAQNKYGDCKALSNYFKSVLEHFNIKSYLVDVYAGDQVRDIDENFPAQQFNHVILCVPSANDTLWIDCTSDLAFNYLGTFTQNREVLLVKNGESKIVRTPPLQLTDVLESRMIKISSDESFNAIADFTATYRGDKYELFHYVYKNYNETQKKRIIREYLVDDGFELEKYEIIKGNRDSTKIEFNYSAKSNKIYMKYGNELVVKPIPVSLPKLEPVSERKLPVQIDYPIFKIDTIEFKLPNGYKAINRLDEIVIENEFGHYKTKFKNEDNKVIFIRQFLIKPGFYELNKYQLFYDFIKAVKKAENKNNFPISKK